MKLQTKLVLLISTLLFILILILALSFQQLWSASLKDNAGSKALHLAKTVASIPEIKEAFIDPEPWHRIQPLVESIRQQTDAEFIVIGNREGIRYSHPIPGRIGKEMVGGDNEPVFRGESIISEAKGTLGLSLRGKTPIYNDQQEIIGVVSVGFLIEDINETALRHRNNILMIAALALLLGAIGAGFIARGVKRSIMGLEPEEIGRLYQEKDAVLEFIHEGIIAVNREGLITLINQNALQLLGVSDKAALLGHSISNVLPHSTLPDVIRSGSAEFDKEAIVGDNVVVVSRMPVFNKQGEVIGAVSSFRNKSELYLLTQQLSQIRTYADGLRAQTHEFSNKLYTISGLIQLESYQEAIEFITQESDIQRDLLQFILKEIPDPIIGGLLLGAMNRAQEMKVQIEIDRESSFGDIPEALDRNLLVTILGNLINNAIEAVSDQTHKQVSILLTDLGQDLFMEIEDNGPGINPDDLDQIYSVGYSTKKGEHRGFGLALVKKAAIQLGGMIEYNPVLGGGSRFSVAIPKKGVRSQ
jgi:two-component system CitB family sensor kinase